MTDLLRCQSGDAGLAMLCSLPEWTVFLPLKSRGEYLENVTPMTMSILDLTLHFRFHAPTLEDIAKKLEGPSAPPRLDSHSGYKASRQVRSCCPMYTNPEPATMNAQRYEVIPHRCECLRDYQGKH